MNFITNAYYYSYYYFYFGLKGSGKSYAYM